MKRLLCTALVGGVTLLACDTPVVPPATGGITLRVWMIGDAPSEGSAAGVGAPGVTQGPLSHLDSARVILTGPTAKTVSVTPGTNVTIDGLAPGSYTVVLEGWANDEVAFAGRVTAVAVVAGEDNTVADVLFAPTTLDFAAIGETRQLDSPSGTSWGSSDETVATVDAAGLVTAVSNGQATITGTLGSSTVNITAAVAQEVATVTVTPTTITLVSVGETVQLTASASDASGNAISGKTFTWSSSDASIATVSASGLVSAVANGSVTITATADGIDGTATILVDQVGTQLVFTVEPTTTIVGRSIMVEVAIQDALGNLVAGATDAVTVAIGTNPGGGTLSGATTVNAMAGVTSFTDLTIDQMGTGYTLVVTSGSLSSATSAAFAILDFPVTVNTTDDLDDGTCNVTHCSLREALNTANANPGIDLIEFNIPGPGPHTIQPLSALPRITDPVVIDGYTQPGASPNTNGPGLGTNAVLKIELDGTNVLGFQPLTISAGNSTVRGLVINRFEVTGVLLTSNGGNVIEGNFIGTDVTGTVGLGNGFGLNIRGSNNNTIGGLKAAARNVISGNSNQGVSIAFAGTTGNMILGNFIGTDVTGTAALGNATGVRITGAPDNTIGGTTTAARNVISGNSSRGILIDAQNVPATGNLVQGNFIGIDVTGFALGNGQEGVLIAGAASSNTVGGVGSGAGNTIAFNRFGVLVSSGTDNAVLSNSIFSNAGGQGIGLGPGGITPNDAGDGDTGANNLQNFPVLTSATSGSGSITIVGNLNSTAITDFRLELFANSVCDPSGNGEGETFLGSTMVTTDGSGDASFTVTFTVTVPAGQFITATATDPNNNTSEFSQCTAVA